VTCRGFAPSASAIQIWLEPERSEVKAIWVSSGDTAGCQAAIPRMRRRGVPPFASTAKNVLVPFSWPWKITSLPTQRTPAAPTQLPTPDVSAFAEAAEGVSKPTV
jgi:hypothetical protein